MKQKWASIFGGLFLAASALPVSAGINDGLVGNWNFDSCDVTDTSGYGNTGSTGASCVTGKIGNALTFNGSNSVSLPQSSSLYPSQFTISGWINTTNYSSDANVGSILFSNYDGYYHGLIYYLSNAGKISLRISHGASAGQSVDEVKGSTTIGLNVWTHVATTFDGSSMKVFVNGIEDGVASFGYAYSAATSAAPAIAKASWSSLPVNYFVGGIDEVRFYNRALSNVEIQQLASYGTCDTTTSYNEGYSAGQTAAQAACRSDPASCGITTGTGTSGSHAAYNPTTNQVHIPLLDVPSIFGGTPTVFETDWTLVPNSNPLQLQLQNARQVP